jgi:C4-dicarboxylate transporter DctQ subunit
LRRRGANAVRFKWFERVEEGLIAFLLAAMTLVSFAQVVARYVFNYSFTWALELTMVCFAWLIFLGIPYGVRIGSHIGVDALVKALGPKSARVAGIAGASLCVVYSAILLAGSWTYVTKMYELGIDMDDLPNVPIWVPRTILVFSYALLVLRFSQVLYRIVVGREIRLHQGDEAEELLRQQREVMGEPHPGEGPK